MITNRYDDILHLPHPVSRKHPQMPIQDRAAQFMPFMALTGYKDAVSETERLTEEWMELDENERETLDRKLCFLIEHREEHPEVTVTYFQPDERKDGGAYRTISGKLRKLDADRRSVLLDNGACILLESIVQMEVEGFCE